MISEKPSRDRHAQTVDPSTHKRKTTVRTRVSPALRPPKCAICCRCSESGVLSETRNRWFGIHATSTISHGHSRLFLWLHSWRRMLLQTVPIICFLRHGTPSCCCLGLCKRSYPAICCRSKSLAGLVVAFPGVCSSLWSSTIWTVLILEALSVLHMHTRTLIYSSFIYIYIFPPVLGASCSCS